MHILVCQKWRSIIHHYHEIFSQIYLHLFLSKQHRFNYSWTCFVTISLDNRSLTLIYSIWFLSRSHECFALLFEMRLISRLIQRLTQTNFKWSYFATHLSFNFCRFWKKKFFHFTIFFNFLIARLLLILFAVFARFISFTFLIMSIKRTLNLIVCEFVEYFSFALRLSWHSRCRSNWYWV